ncbi:MAG: helix-turn-helix domain-containing protein [Patescibacteria group bacterium]|nr:helix-turn-helix domain-containing protein [Patescibacteria group bacterium]
MPSPKDLLTQLNLTDHEAEIYLAALGLGSASVNDIAKKIGKSRTATYFHLDHLLKKGIIKQSRKGKLARFIAKSPEEVVADAEQIVNQLKDVLPLLRSLRKKESQAPLIEIFDSKEGYKKIYETITALSKGSTYRLLEGPRAVALELGSMTQAEWTEYLKMTIAKNIGSKALVTESTQRMTPQKFTRENELLLRKRVWNMRTVPDSVMPFQELMLICGDKVLFLFADIDLVMIIQHESIAGMLALMFDGLYIQGKPVAHAWA